MIKFNLSAVSSCKSRCRTYGMWEVISRLWSYFRGNLRGKACHTNGSCMFLLWAGSSSPGPASTLCLFNKVRQTLSEELGIITGVTAELSPEWDQRRGPPQVAIKMSPVCSLPYFTLPSASCNWLHTPHGHRRTPSSTFLHIASTEVRSFGSAELRRICRSEFRVTAGWPSLLPVN